jgi:hypothetical protein
MTWQSGFGGAGRGRVRFGMAGPVQMSKNGSKEPEPIDGKPHPRPPPSKPLPPPQKPTGKQI